MVAVVRPFVGPMPLTSHGIKLFTVHVEPYSKPSRTAYLASTSRRPFFFVNLSLPPSLSGERQTERRATACYPFFPPFAFLITPPLILQRRTFRVAAKSGVILHVCFLSDLTSSSLRFSQLASSGGNDFSALHLGVFEYRRQADGWGHQFQLVLLVTACVFLPGVLEYFFRRCLLLYPNPQVL